MEDCVKLEGFVNLEINNMLVGCDKSLLINNSDYFRAMFDGNYVESTKATIKLQDIDIQGINLILYIISTENYDIMNYDNVFLILPTACILQFTSIQQRCYNMLTEMLDDKNCDVVWLALERTLLRPTIYFKAKYMALINFPVIGFSKQRLDDFNLSDICNYLGDTNLNCKTEVDVLNSALLWCETIETIHLEEAFKLLSCIDFQSIDVTELKTVQTKYPILSNIINCIINIKCKQSLEQFDEIVVGQSKLLLQSNPRLKQQLPCISLYNENSTDSMTVVYYDMKESKFKKLLNYNFTNIENLKGFTMFNYLNYICVYGGEFLIGYGAWNSKISKYNLTTDQIEHYNFPFVRGAKKDRRHFQDCLINDILYIVAGAASYRVVQEDMFWLNLQKNDRSDIIKLPCSGRQIFSCNLFDQLFILDINFKTGYLFNHSLCAWNKIILTDEANILPSYSTNLSVFGFDNKLFIKGNNLIELELSSNEPVQFKIVKVTELTNKPCDCLQSIMCNNTLFTLYKHKCDDHDLLTLETFNMETYKSNYIFENHPVNKIFKVDNEELKYKPDFCLFGLFHYKCLETGSYSINTNFPK